MITIRRVPIHELLKRMRELDEQRKHDEANQVREEIMERLRASVGRGAQ